MSAGVEGNNDACPVGQTASPLRRVTGGCWAGFGENFIVMPETIFGGIRVRSRRLRQALQNREKQPHAKNG